MSQHAFGRNMKKGLYIGIFDPITLGHLDIIERSVKLVDELVIGVLVEPMVSTEICLKDRIRLVNKVMEHYENVKVVEFNGLLSKIIDENGINIMIRGLRMMTDFENELNIVHTASQMNFDVDTIFLCTNEIYANYSAREVRQIAQNHGEVAPFLPECIVEDVKSIYA